MTLKVIAEDGPASHGNANRVHGLSSARTAYRKLRPTTSRDRCNLLYCRNLRRYAPGLLHSDNNITLMIWLQSTLYGALFRQKCDNRSERKAFPPFRTA